MSYKEKLYRNALNKITEIYEQSKYDPDVDLYRSFDILNSINENQFASKEWLIEKLRPFIDHEKHSKFCILGGWYGLIAVMLAQEVSQECRIDTIDCDPKSREFGTRLLGLNEYENIHFRLEDAEEWFHDRPKLYDVIINTSCEHMEPEDLRLITRTKRADSLICFQGNNYHEIQSHINTHNSLDEFVESLDLMEVLYKEALRAPTGNYDRYMVIGK